MVMSPCVHPCMRGVVSTGWPTKHENNNKRGPSAQCTPVQHVTPPFYLLPDQLNQGPLFVVVVVVAIVVVVVVVLVWGTRPIQGTSPSGMPWFRGRYCSLPEERRRPAGRLLHDPPAGRLCTQDSEDPTHFMATCPALDLKRLENLPSAG